jgi:predicted AAA+ superfamily ATPase
MIFPYNDAVIAREEHLNAIRTRLAEFPVVGLIGARQVGKTTLALQLAERVEGPVTRFDLERPEDLARLDDPMLALQDLPGLVILDEVQRRPGLFPILRVLADRPRPAARFLVLGSSSPELLRPSSESLAGRIGYYELPGLRLTEVGLPNSPRLWLRGGFPRSFLADSEAASLRWRRGFIQTFLERDLPSLGIRVPAFTLHRFWRMLAHYHAQRWNGAELARAFGVSASAVRNYLDILTGSLVVRQLQPWFENIGKRQVKAPRVYLADTGLLHALLGMEDQEALEGHPKVGASWEGYVIDQLLQRLGVPWSEAFFWAAHSGAEVDLFLIHHGRRLGFEVKRTTRPTTSRSMHAAIEALRLDALQVIHAGEHSFLLREGIEAIAFQDLFRDPSLF